MNEATRIAWFDAKSRPDERGCLVWLGNLDRNGYPTGQAYRRTFVLYYGEVPAGLELDHVCRTRACVNPLHLEPVTRAENMRRSRGVRRRLPFSGASMCTQGHELIGDNLYVSPGGQRHCRTCSARRSSERYTKQTGRSPEQRRKWVRKS